MASKKRTARSLDEAAPKSAKKTTKKPKKVASRIVVPKAKDYLRLARAMKGVEDEDFAFFSDPLAWTSPVEEWLSTGVLAIDRLTGGGYPVGRVVEIAAWENVGKTTLIDQSIAMAQQLGHVVCLIDSEHARDLSYTVKLGVNPDELIISKADTIEQVFIAIDRLLAIQEAQAKKLLAKKKKPPIMLLAWDSVAGTQTEAEKKGAADDKHVAGAAKIIRMNMRRLKPRLAKARAVLVFANQFYSGIGPFSSISTYGGGGIRYGADIRVWLSRIEAIRRGEDVIGHIIQAKLRKTRVSMPRPPAKVALLFGAGIHNAWTLYDWAKTHGVEEDPSHRWVTQSAAWSRLHVPGEDDKAFQGTFLGFAEQLAHRPALYQKMAELYRAEAV